MSNSGILVRSKIRQCHIDQPNDPPRYDNTFKFVSKYLSHKLALIYHMHTSPWLFQPLLFFVHPMSEDVEFHNPVKMIREENFSQVTIITYKNKYNKNTKDLSSCAKLICTFIMLNSAKYLVPLSVGFSWMFYGLVKNPSYLTMMVTMHRQCDSCMRQ